MKDARPGTGRLHPSPGPQFRSDGQAGRCACGGRRRGSRRGRRRSTGQQRVILKGRRGRPEAKCPRRGCQAPRCRAPEKNASPRSAAFRTRSTESRHSITSHRGGEAPDGSRTTHAARAAPTPAIPQAGERVNRRIIFSGGRTWACSLAQAPSPGGLRVGGAAPAVRGAGNPTGGRCCLQTGGKGRLSRDSRGGQSPSAPGGSRRRP